MKKKVISISVVILFSTFLWGSVTLSGDFITTIKVPVELIDLPQNYTTGSLSNKEVFIRIRAKGWDFAKLNISGNVEFSISARKKVGKQKTDLRNEIENNNWLTSSFHIIEIAPAFIDFEVDKILTKKVFVRQNLKVEFEQGYGLASEVNITPSEVEISGPFSVIEKIDTILTEFKEFNNISEKFSSELSFAELKGIKIDTKVCLVEFDVQKIVDKSFDDIIVELRNVPPSKELVLFPSKISIVLKGGINKIGRLTNDSIKAYVDFWQVLRSSSETIKPVILIPNNTTLIDLRPKKLEFVIKQY
jgi:YbbR domain-containing protein